MMQKANIITRKTKKGVLIAEIRFENGKSMPVPQKFSIDPNMNGKECEVERDSAGQPIKIIVDGKELKLKAKNNQSRSNRNSKNSYRQSRTKQTYNNNVRTNSDRSNIFSATAPYNFVPLNHEIVAQGKPKPFDKYEGNTGYIDLEIETKTPIYIRGVNKGNEEDPDFYKQAGKYRIPGSSIRGMIRTMVEIVSWSKFGYFNDDYLYYRTFVDTALSMRKEYIKHMSSTDVRGNIQRKMSSGLLYIKGINYYIIPAEKKFEPIQKSASRNYDEYPGYYGYNKLSENKYLVVPGKKFKPIDEKKQNDWIVYADKNATNKAIQIDEKDIWNYKNDKNRKAPDITRIDKNEFRPCFYVKWKDGDGKERISFGHVPFFRISYEKSIGEHITQDEAEEFDIAESIFGDENDFMTRVFFEDAFLNKGDYNKISAQIKIPKILSGPKPTSFQLYLEQNGADIEPIYNKGKFSGWKGIKSYNDQTEIRGNKLYWHQDDTNWEEKSASEISKHKTQYTRIKPIAAGAKFFGRIRFENLTDIELGALLFAIDLPKGLAHKIGMAKPLGLGSTRIDSSLHLSNRANRYKNLIAEWDGIPNSNKKINEFKLKFEKYIMNKINEHEKSLWQTKRLKELSSILDFANKPPASSIKYMELKEFKERKILPRPTEIKENIDLYKQH